MALRLHRCVLRFLGDLVPAQVNVREYLENFCLFLDARLFTVMNQDADRLDFFDASYGGGYDTGHAPWKKCWLVFNRNGTSFAGSGEAATVHAVDSPFVKAGVRCTPVHHRRCAGRSLCFKKSSSYL